MRHIRILVALFMGLFLLSQSAIAKEKKGHKKPKQQAQESVDEKKSEIPEPAKTESKDEAPVAPPINPDAKIETEEPSGGGGW